jgi:arsenite transporter
MDDEPPNSPSANAINGHFPAGSDLERKKEKEAVDLEQQTRPQPPKEAKASVYNSLGWLDRLLALWILLAIIVGILLGNYVDSVGPALQRGKFVQVSMPIGRACLRELKMIFPLICSSCGLACHDVSYTVQNQV